METKDSFRVKRCWVLFTLCFKFLIFTVLTLSVHEHTSNKDTMHYLGRWMLPKEQKEQLGEHKDKLTN